MAKEPAIGENKQELMSVVNDISQDKNSRYSWIVRTENGKILKRHKVLKCLNQCFARLRSKKSVSSKTAVDPAGRFCEFETLFPTFKVCKTLV